MSTSTTPESRTTVVKKISPAAWGFTIAAIVITTLIVVLLAVQGREAKPPADPVPPKPAQTSQVPPAIEKVENLTGTRQLNSVDSATATFVEFLDFECEACAAMLPEIDKLETAYGDRVSFETRYFPLPSHFNSVRAARAAEAAARQDKYVEMLRKLYDKQPVWGEKKTPADDTFRQYAKDLGLDIAQWEEDYNSPEVLALIEKDIELGKRIGVTGTPTLFLNGEVLQPQTYQDLSDAVEAALR